MLPTNIKLTPLKPPQYYLEGLCQVWCECVHKGGLYTGFHSLDTGFGPLLVEITLLKPPRWYFKMANRFSGI
jgi:hypothetical protein